MDLETQVEEAVIADVPNLLGRSVNCREIEDGIWLPKLYSSLNVVK
jgi:hypothetical protein